MEPYKENLSIHDLPFPVDIFMKDNLESHIVSDPHWHDCLEILYMLEGTAEQRVNDKYVKVGKHDIIILNEGDIHGTYCTPGENVRILVIKFMPDIIDNSFSRVFESKYIQAFLNNRSSDSRHVLRALKNSTGIHSLMLGLYEEFMKKEAGYEIFIKGYIYQLIASLIRNDIYNPLHKENDLLRLDKLFKYIESHYNERINLEEAAKMYNLSYSYFSRYFKRITGRTFREYIDFVKVCEVEKLILSKTMSISQAAYEAGFCNVSSFNRVFKRVRGYTPGEIKRSKANEQKLGVHD